MYYFYNPWSLTDIDINDGARQIASVDAEDLRARKASLRNSVMFYALFECLKNAMRIQNDLDYAKKKKLESKGSATASSERLFPEEPKTPGRPTRPA
jgi:hypothetical protein